MKLISEHLGEIIVAIAGVALLVSCVVFFQEEITGFFSNIVSTLTTKGNDMLNSINVPAAK